MPIAPDPLRSFAAVLSAALLAACGGGGGDSTTPPGGGGPNPPGPGAWVIETADAGTTNTGVNPSIAVDHLGTVHVSHLDLAGYRNENYRYARRTGSGWTASGIETAKLNTSVAPYGQWSSIAVDSAGVPAVTYHRSDVGYYYRKRNAAGTAWNAPVLIPTPETAWAFLGHNALAIDPDGAASVHVALWLYKSPGLDAGYYPAYWTTGASGTVRVDAADTATRYDDNGIHATIALDPAGRPHLAFIRGDEGAAKTYWAWAEPSGSGWTIHDVEVTGVPGTSNDEKLCALALDANGRPHLLYLKPPSGAGNPSGYRYATWSGAAWTIETIAQPPTSGLSALALALDASGVPHVAYYGANDHVWYAKRTGANAWAKEIVDASSNDTGYGVAIAVDAGGHVHIAYRSMPTGTTGSLKYARR